MRAKELIYTNDIFKYIEGCANKYEEEGKNNFEKGLKALKEEYLDLIDHEEEITEDDAFDLVSDNIMTEYNDLLDQLDRLVNANDTVLYGSLGRWNGTAKIYPERFGYISEAIKKVATSCDNIYIYKHYGKIKIVGTHHDGTNNFYISLLNDKGQDATENANLSLPCYHRAIKWENF